MPTHFPLPLAYWGLSTTSWIVLWSVLGGMTILLVILLSTRWSKARPWRKCAILSLWVHVLLACLATTVRIVTGAPDSGDGQPIRVAVMPTFEETAQTEDEVLPHWEMPSEPSLIAPELEPLEAPALEPLAPESDLATDEQANEDDASPVPSEPFPLESPLADAMAESPPEDLEPESLPEDAQSQPLAEATTLPQPSVAPNDQKANVATPPPPVQSEKLPTSYSDRFADNREQITEEHGGSEQTEQAVRAALGWLSRSQSPNGGWDASRFGAGHENYVLGEDRRGAGTNADTGVTGLALLAFLGSGHTHLAGPYANEVAGGLEYLRQRQRSNGALYGDAQVYAQTYCHAMATFAVCEALAMTRDRRLEPTARAAIEYTLSLQHPTDGGWRYLRGHRGDTSQLGWQLMTLKSAHLAEIPVPAASWSRSERFLRSVTRGNAGGLAAYLPEAPVSRSMTAEAMFCRQVHAERYGETVPPDTAAEATASILDELPTSQKPNLYYWYYATLALHRNQNQSPAAREAWDNWNHALTTALLTTQQGDGSWSTDTMWGGYGGQVYTTSLAAMCLEVYYRYTPDKSPAELARLWQPVPR